MSLRHAEGSKAEDVAFGPRDAGKRSWKGNVADIEWMYYWKNIIMYYNMLLERWDKTEASDILHFKIARGMKKL